MAQAKDGPVPLDPQDDVKYQYLWNCREYLDPLTKIVIATDADDPGQALAEELSRRLGRERCWRVVWPTTQAEVPGSEFIMEVSVEFRRTTQLSVRSMSKFRVIAKSTVHKSVVVEIGWLWRMVRRRVQRRAPLRSLRAERCSAKTPTRCSSRTGLRRWRRLSSGCERSSMPNPNPGSLTQLITHTHTYTHTTL